METLNAPPPERTKRISQSASEATAGAKTAGVTVSGQEGQSSSAANAREDGLPRTGETPEGVVSEDGWVEAPSAAAAPEEGSDDDEEGDSFEEERRFYTRLRLQCEDLAVVRTAWRWVEWGGAGECIVFFSTPKCGVNLRNTLSAQAEVSSYSYASGLCFTLMGGVCVRWGFLWTVPLVQVLFVSYSPKPWNLMWKKKTFPQSRSAGGHKRA